jgi:hypothetical protein
MSALDPAKVTTHQELLPDGVEYTEKFLLVNGKEIEVVINDNDLEELEKYERFFVWAGFMPKKTIDDMLKTAVTMRKINKAVLQDLEDYIIAQGMEPLPSDYNKNKSNFFDILKKKSFGQG